MLRNRAKRKYGTVAQEIQFSEFYRTAIITIRQIYEIEVVWTFMTFKIYLYFWGVFGSWRGSVASYTTDERAENGQKERWRLNLEELKLQINSSSEKVRRLHCLHLISYAFLRAHTRITMRISAFLPSHSDRYHPLIIAWKIRGTSGMITWDPDAPKKNFAVQ